MHLGEHVDTDVVLAKNEHYDDDKEEVGPRILVRVNRQVQRDERRPKRHCEQDVEGLRGVEADGGPGLAAAEERLVEDVGGGVRYVLHFY